MKELSSPKQGEQMKQLLLISLLLLSFLTSSSIVQSLPNNNENTPFLSYSQQQQEQEYNAYNNNEDTEDSKTSSINKSQYSLNYKAVGTILHITCEINQRLLYKTNCRVGHHSEVIEQDEQQSKTLNSLVTPTCSSSTSEVAEEKEEEKSLFHSKEKLQSTKDISTFLQEIQSIFQLSNNHWNIPLAVYYLNLVTRISSNTPITTPHRIPHLTYHTLKKLLLTCMILSKRVLSDYYQFDEFYYDTTILPSLQQILSKYNITQQELQSMEYTVLQTLASNTYINDEHHYNSNIHLRDVLYVHSEMIQNMITSWEIALDNVPIFIHKPAPNTNNKKSYVVPKQNDKKEVEEIILLNRLSKQHHKSHLRNPNGHYDTPLLDRLFQQQQQRTYIGDNDGNSSNSTTSSMNSVLAHVQ